MLTYLLRGCLLVLLLRGPAGATPTDTLVLSLEECIEYALQHNLQLQQDALAAETARVAVSEAKGLLLPSVSGVGRYNYNVGRSVNPVTNDFTDQPVRSQDYGLSANLTLFDGWRTIRTIRYRQDDLRAVQYELSASQRQVVLTVIQTYLEVLTQQELLVEARRRHRQTRHEIARTQRLITSGEVSPTQRTQLEAQRADDQLTVVQRKNGQQLALLRLRQLLNVPVKQPVRVLPPPSADQRVVATLPSLPELYQRAQRVDPALQGAALRQAMAQQAIKIAKGAYLPVLQATAGGYSSYSDNPPPFLEQLSYGGQLDFNLRKFVGLELSIPIFSQGQVRGAVQRAKIDQRRADVAVLQQQQQLWETLETIHGNAQAAVEEYRAAQERVVAVRKAFRSATTQLSLGVIDILGYSQAKQQLNEAMAYRVQAKYRALFHRRLLTFYQQ